MSRIGRLPVAIPAGVEVKMDGNTLVVKGKLGELKREMKPCIKLEVADGHAHLLRDNDEKETKALHGMYRALLANMVKGVSEGFEKGLTINGVGYKAVLQGKKLVMNIGFSHQVTVEEPAGIKFECPTQTDITIKGIDNILVGQVAANIKAMRKPEPYHGYGIRYKDEVILHKEGKTAGK